MNRVDLSTMAFKIFLLDYLFRLVRTVNEGDLSILKSAKHVKIVLFG